MIYRQLLPNTDNYCQIQTNIAKYRQLLSNTDKYCHILLLLFSRCQTCSGQKCLHLSIYVEKAKQKMLAENMRDRLKPPIRATLLTLSGRDFKKRCPKIRALVNPLPPPFWATLLTLSGRHDVLRDFNLVKKRCPKNLGIGKPPPHHFGQCPNWKVFFCLDVFDSILARFFLMDTIGQFSHRRDLAIHYILSQTR